MTEFIEFPKISRFSRECVVTEKIDGTNSTVFIGEDGEFLLGSRTRWITPEDDNYGFARWATEHKAELITMGPGWHRGEWWGSKIQRGYGLINGERRWSLFNVARWCLAGQTPQQIPCGDPRMVKFQDVLPACVGLVPLLWRGSFDYLDCESIIANLTINGSRAMSGYNNPEGIVIFHVAGNISFKKTIAKDEEHKSVTK